MTWVTKSLYLQSVSKGVGNFRSAPVVLATQATGRACSEDILASM